MAAAKLWFLPFVFGLKSISNLNWQDQPTKATMSSNPPQQEPAAGKLEMLHVLFEKSSRLLFFFFLEICMIYIICTS